MTTYGVLILQCDRQDHVNQLKQAIALELNVLGLHKSVAIAVTEARPTDEAPSVAVFLGSPDAKSDVDLNARTQMALDDGVLILPVVSTLENFANEVPTIIAHANGMAWSNDSDLSRLIRVILEELGIEERQRRVFVSHRREDGLGAAEQLHDRLTHANFQPFIDRFAIRRGRDVQQEIADALEDHAFLLLLESPLAHTSDWVFDEVDYALSHTMGILIVSWPDNPPQVPGSQGLPRLILTRDEITHDQHGFEILTESAMERLITKIESSHALGLVRRRRMLLRSIEESAQAAGVTCCTPLRGWRLLVEQNNGSMIVGTTPRLPTAEDLQAVEQASTAQGASEPALLVHSARQLPSRLKDHLTWVAGDRKLGIIPENAIGRWW